MARQSGFSLLEIMLVVALSAIIAVIAVGSYSRYALRARDAAAVADIGRIQMELARYDLNNNGLPPSLAEVRLDTLRDPWGRPYVYLSFAGMRGVGSMRKDHSLVPLNTDYDLYSKGPDGDSRMPLSAQVSKDDVIRANDGHYIGVAVDY